MLPRCANSKFKLPMMSYRHTLLTVLRQNYNILYPGSWARCIHHMHKSHVTCNWKFTETALIEQGENNISLVPAASIDQLI